ncbi:putative Nucleolar protein,Nop52 domain containing protein [Neospora caninum Liverpool]|uniref:Nucleolar protein,Nop52 domain containing protein, putative n=1 Tax=Neospora caninum (strain Liverpool) TaxID=572307 RepID=F0VM64_NEOCL|nr:putative Nucleolar protein,Nop52 domain containing protein [Neospora caninum Liverpool]CBZ54342.1 putative Nucleolar protein,Nop52 domain containing protein [Neospora caninum Liverpool]CEL69047.1 TPA: Nucleolar protein,Nop52 domain containing protein, putative [Neospora caninum Liverpool]|eukprot:XP_003884373.1 putative Nucleolar protein,Nop52 domain containing protein [Neospora caninum Liverpool]
MVRVGRSHSQSLSATSFPYRNGATPAARVPAALAPQSRPAASRGGDHDERLVAMARLLAHTDVKYRNQGLKRVEAFLSGVSRQRRKRGAADAQDGETLGEAENAAENPKAPSPLPFSQYEKVWTTLYYAAWLSDKPLVQRELFVCLALLERVLPTFAEKRKFFKAFFLVMKRNWDKLDCIRVNKFLLLERIMVAELLHLMLQAANRPQKFVFPMGRFLAERILLDERGGNGLAQQLGLYFLSEYRVARSQDVAAVSASDASWTEAKDSDSEEDSSLQKVGQEDSEKLFFAFFFPFFYAACFTESPAMLRAIHTQVLLELNEEDLRPRVLAAALFTLASLPSVRGDNRRALFRTLDALEAQVGSEDRASSLSAVAAASPGIQLLLTQVTSLRGSGTAPRAPGEDSLKPEKQGDVNRRGGAAAAYDDGETCISFPRPLADAPEDACEEGPARSTLREGKRKRERGAGDSKKQGGRGEGGEGLETSGAGDSVSKKLERKADLEVSKAGQCSPQAAAAVHNADTACTPKKAKTGKLEFARTEEACAAECALGKKGKSRGCSIDDDGLPDGLSQAMSDGEQFVGKRKKFLGDASLSSGGALNARAKKLRAGALGSADAAGVCLLAAGDESPSWPRGLEERRRGVGLQAGKAVSGLNGPRGSFLASSLLQRDDDSESDTAPSFLGSAVHGSCSPLSPRKSPEKAFSKVRKVRGTDASPEEDGREGGSPEAKTPTQKQENANCGLGKASGGGEGDTGEASAKTAQGDASGYSGDDTWSGEGARGQECGSDEEVMEDDRKAKKERKKRQSEKQRKKEERQRRRKERRGLLPSSLSVPGSTDASQLGEETGDEAPLLRTQTKKTKKVRAAGLASEAASPSNAERNAGGKHRGSKTGFLVPSGAARATERRRVVFDLKRNRVTAFNRLQPPSAVSPSVSQADLLPGVRRPTAGSCGGSTSTLSSKGAAEGGVASFASASSPSRLSSASPSLVSVSGLSSGAEDRAALAAQTAPVLKSILKRPVGACLALSEHPHWVSSSSPSSGNASAASTPRALKAKPANKTLAGRSPNLGAALALPDGDFQSPSPTAEGALQLPLFLPGKKRSKREKRKAELEKKGKNRGSAKTVIALPSGSWDAVAHEAATDKREEEVHGREM